MATLNSLEPLAPVSATTVRVRWLAVEDGAAEHWRDVASLLDEDERARASRFHFEHDRHSYIAAHALARIMLSEEVLRPPADWRFKTNSHGKPEVVRDPGQAPLRFSLTHTRGLVAVATTLTHDIGIDAEVINQQRLNPELAERMFAAAEVAQLRAAPAPALSDTLFAIWTLKEACLKAIGRGLSLPLDAFAVTLDPLSVAFSDAHREHQNHWMLWRMSPTPSHALALALRHSEPAAVTINAAAIDVSELLAIAGELRSKSSQSDARL